MSRKPVQLPGHISHGSFSAWQRYGCKCETCRDHWRSTQKRYRAQRRDFLFSEVPHGLKGYNYYGCRCDTCCGARRAYDRERWETKQRALEMTPERRERKRAYDRARAEQKRSKS